jgi:hypothetical protein
MKLLALFTAMMLSTAAHAAGEEQCASVKTYPVPYALCLAHHGNDDRCNALDEPFKQQCLGRAKNSATPCSSLDEVDKGVCTGVALKNYSKCPSDDAEKKAWCVALAKGNDGTCSAAGALKTDCNRIAGLLEELAKVVVTTTDTTTTATTTTTTDSATVKQLRTDLGSGAVDELLKSFSEDEIVKWRDGLGKDRLKRYEGSLKTAGLKKIADASVTPKQLKDVADAATDDKVEALGADALVAILPQITATQVGELLTTPPTAYVKDLAERTDGGKLIKEMVAHFGSAANFGTILGKASGATMPVEDLEKFLGACKDKGWKKVTEVGAYFGYTTSSATWDVRLAWAKTLTDTTLGQTTDYGGRSVADPSAPHKVTLKDSTGADVVITFNGDDAKHVYTRHTWDGFAVKMGNCKPLNSMFPLSTKSTDILALGAKVLASNEAKNLVAGMTGADSNLGQVVIDGVTIEFRITLNGINGMVSFYPVSGTGVENVDKDGMRGAITLYKSK